MAAHDPVKIIAIYGDDAFGTDPNNTSVPSPLLNSNWLAAPLSVRSQKIQSFVSRGVNVVYLSNSNYTSTGGFSGTNYSSAWTALILQFITEANARGLEVGQVIGMDATNGPAQKVKNYNISNPTKKISRVLIEKEYWSGNGTYAQFQSQAANVRSLLNSQGVSVDAYLANWQPGEMAGLVGIIDTFWLTNYNNKPEYKRPVFGQSISSAVNEIAAANPAQPVKVGAMVSIESYEYNATGGYSSSNNFLGYFMSGQDIASGVVAPAGSGTIKSFQELADFYSHQGIFDTPSPSCFNNEASLVQSKIDWQGINVYSSRWLGTVPVNLKRKDDTIYLIGDGADLGNIAVAKNVASQVDQIAGRFIYLGDVYEDGDAHDYIEQYDLIYGSGINNGATDLRIKTSAIMANHEYPNRANTTGGYDKYWRGLMAGQTSGSYTVDPLWEGSRTKLNPRYYSFYLNDWKFILIDTMEDGFPGGGMTIGSPQYNWMVSELAEPGAKKIVCGHHPRWSSSPGHPDNPDMQPVWAAMQGHALLYMCGHSHTFQIHNMRNSAGIVTPTGGVYQIVSGCGGRPLSGYYSSYLDANGNDPILFSGKAAPKYGGTRLVTSPTGIEACFFDQFGAISGCQTFSLSVGVNVPPVVDAGPNISATIPAMATTSATATDDGLLQPLTYAWTVVSGPGTITFSDPTILNPTVSASAAGVYVLQLSVSDGQNIITDTTQATFSAGAPFKTLGIDSTNPSSGVLITVSVADINGRQDGVTVNPPFTLMRDYLLATSVTLTAPATAPGGGTFLKWVQDGVDLSLLPSITLSDSISHTLVAVYSTVNPHKWPVYVNSSCPGTGVAITGININDGVTPFAQLIAQGTQLALTAPAIVGGRAFKYWMQDGGTVLTTNRVLSAFFVNSPVTLTACYEPAPGEFNVLLYLDTSILPNYFNTQPLLIKILGGIPNYDGTGSTTGVPVGVAQFNGWSGTNGSWNISIVEWDQTYSVSFEDSTGSLASTSLFLIRTAVPSARLDIIQPNNCNPSGGSLILNTPSNIIPGGGVFYPITYNWDNSSHLQYRNGLAAGSYYVTAHDSAASAGVIVDQELIENYNLSNFVPNGQMTTNPGWTTSGASYVNLYNKYTLLAAGYVEFTVNTVIGRLYSGGAWVTGTGALGDAVAAVDGAYINGASISNASPFLEFLNFFFVASATSHVVRITFSQIGELYRVILQEFDTTFNATLVAPSGTPLSAISTITNPSCYGGYNGSITVTASNGTPAYHYVWTKSGGSGLTFPDAPTITNLYPGTYQCIVHDACGSVTLSGLVVTDPASIVIAKTVTNVLCYGGTGSASFSSTGGYAPYTYMVDNIAIAGNVATGLSVGTHLVSVFDSAGCSAESSFTLTQPTNPLTGNANASVIKCKGGLSTISLDYHGGTPPYTAQLNSGSVEAVSTYLHSFTNVSPGTHSIRMRDANGCMIVKTVVITEPLSEIVLSATTVNPSTSTSSDGSATIYFAGGIPVYSLSLNGVSAYNLYSLSPGSHTYNGLAEGSYTATLIDSLACTRTVNFSLSAANIVTPPNDGSDTYNEEKLRRKMVRLACCFGDKAYSLLKKFSNGHIDLDCCIDPILSLKSMINTLSCWHAKGSGSLNMGGESAFIDITIVGSSPVAIENFNVDIYVGSEQKLLVTYEWDINSSVLENMTALSAAVAGSAAILYGFTIHFDSSYGILRVFAPAGEWFNGQSFFISQPGFDSLGGKLDSLWGPYFSGGCESCLAEDVLETYCLSEQNVVSMLEQMESYCGSCMCDTPDNIVKDI